MFLSIRWSKKKVAPPGKKNQFRLSGWRVAWMYQILCINSLNYLLTMDNVPGIAALKPSRVNSKLQLRGPSTAQDRVQIHHAALTQNVSSQRTSHTVLDPVHVTLVVIEALLSSQCGETLQRALPFWGRGDRCIPPCHYFRASVSCKKALQMQGIVLSFLSCGE